MLNENKLIVEGEMGLEISPAGEKLRANLRFKPREGLISKLLRNFNMDVKVHLTLKDLLESWKTGH